MRVDSISIDSLIGGFVVCLMLVAFPKVAAWLEVRRDGRLLGLDPNDPKTHRDFATLYRVLGGFGLTTFGALIVVKMLLA